MNNWVQVRLVGTLSNFNGYGAMVTISSGRNSQIREMSQTTPGGHMSGQNVPVHFGIAMATVVDWICIAWPSGQLQTISNVPANRIVVAVEPTRTPITAGTCPFFVDTRTFATSAFANHCNDEMMYCDANAICSFDSVALRTYCTCKPGFVGNGMPGQCM